MLYERVRSTIRKKNGMTKSKERVMMNVNVRKRVLGLTTMLMASGVWAGSASELMEEAIYADHTRGDPQAAIHLYDAVVEASDVTRDEMAKALYHKGLCQLLLDEERAACATFERLVAEFSEQSHLIAEAKRMLAELSMPDPAVLMPGDRTLLYAEIGNPGRQVETILKLIQGTPIAQNLNALGQGGGIAAILNPSMLAELQKVRGMALGVMDTESNHQPDFLAVLFPGESDALWGMLKAGVGMVAAPGEPIGDFQIASVDGEVEFAYNDTVLLVARGSGYVEEAIAKYQGQSRRTTITKNACFLESIDRQRRQNNTLTVWADVDSAHAHLVQGLGPHGLPNEIRLYNEVLDLANIDELTLELALNNDEIQAEADAHLKAGHNCLAYQLIRTPALSQKGFAGIPDDTVAIVSLALNEDMDEERLRALGADTGLELLRDLISNVEQLNLFAVKGGQSRTSYAELIGNVGLSLTSYDAANTEAVLNQYVRESWLPISKRCAGDANIFSMNPELVERFVATADAGQGVSIAGPLAASIAAWPPNTSKAVLLNVGGVLDVLTPVWQQDASDQDREKMEPALQTLVELFHKTQVELRTVETEDEFRIQFKVSSLPELWKAVAPLRTLAITGKREIVSVSVRTKTKPNMLSCQVTHATAPIAIDGVLDDAWQNAEVIELSGRGNRPAVNDTSATTRLKYDDDYLYILVDVTDAKVMGKLSDFWFSDGVEVYLDAGNDKAKEYGADDFLFYACWLNDKLSAGEFRNGADDLAEWALVKTPAGYVAEGRFPWAKLGVDPLPGTKVGFDMKVNESPDGRSRVGELTWNDKGDNASHIPAYLGTIVLNEPAAE
jgi:hypothetical protein